MSEKKRRAGAALLCAACAAAALFFATTSAPRYATNFWSDTNIYFTVGRGMLSGLMPYRDLFDHKGPLLYMLYALGALVSDTGYAGVFLLQVASLTAFLYLGWRTVRLYVPGPLALAAVPVMALVTATCDAYGQGGSAEEFCLPALALGLYAALARLRDAPDMPDKRAARLDVAFGAAAGWVFAIKYTVCGLFFGLGLALLLRDACARGFKRAARAALRMALGFAALLAVPALVLLAGGALPDCLRVYFFENLAYGGDTRTLYSRFYGAYHALLEGCAGNPAVALLAAAGLLFSAAEALARGRREGAPVASAALSALAAPLGAGMLLLLVYWGSLRHAYYALVFAALAPLGVAAALFPARRAGPRASAGIALALALLVAPVCRAVCPVVPLASIRREDMAQTAFAALMRQEDDPTLLDLSGLDEGFYLASGILPRCRYFVNNNLNTEEKLTAFAAYVANREPQFIVTSFRPLEADGYALVAEMDECIFDLNDPRPYRLYRRVEGDDDGEEDGGAG